jgi:hypothetical protein
MLARTQAHPDERVRSDCDGQTLGKQQRRGSLRRRRRELGRRRDARRAPPQLVVRAAIKLDLARALVALRRAAPRQPAHASMVRLEELTSAGGDNVGVGAVIVVSRTLARRFGELERAELVEVRGLLGVKPRRDAARHVGALGAVRAPLRCRCFHHRPHRHEERVRVPRPPVARQDRQALDSDRRGLCERRQQVRREGRVLEERG